MKKEERMKDLEDIISIRQNKPHVLGMGYIKVIGLKGAGHSSIAVKIDDPVEESIAAINDALEMPYGWCQVRDPEKPANYHTGYSCGWWGY